MATAVDNCTPPDDLQVTYSDDDSGVAGCGVLIRTWTAIDLCGNESNCDQRITITDEEAPIITCPDNITINCSDPPDPSLTGFGQAIDNCTEPGNIQITFTDDNSGLTDCNETGVLLRTWMATDQCGNVSTCEQTITIIDNTAPVISCPVDIVVLCGAPVDPANTGFPLAEDNCGDIVISWEDDTVVDCPGVIIRTFTVIDACGNSSQCNQMIQIVLGMIDQTAPTAFDDGTPPLLLGLPPLLQQADQLHPEAPYPEELGAALQNQGVEHPPATAVVSTKQWTEPTNAIAIQLPLVKNTSVQGRIGIQKGAYYHQLSGTDLPNALQWIQPFEHQQVMIDGRYHWSVLRIPVYAGAGLHWQQQTTDNGHLWGPGIRQSLGGQRHRDLLSGYWTAGLQVPITGSFYLDMEVIGDRQRMQQVGFLLRMAID
jgi:hypothetical protein